MKDTLGELLLIQEMVTPQQLEEALKHHALRGGTLSQAFVGLGFVKDEEITSLLSRQYGVSPVDLDDVVIDPKTIKVIPAETVRK